MIRKGVHENNRRISNRSKFFLSISPPIIRRPVSLFTFYLSSENIKNKIKFVKKIGILFIGFQDLLRMFLV